MYALYSAGESCRQHTQLIRFCCAPLGVGCSADLRSTYRRDVELGLARAHGGVRCDMGEVDDGDNTAERRGYGELSAIGASLNSRPGSPSPSVRPVPLCLHSRLTFGHDPDMAASTKGDHATSRIHRRLPRDARVTARHPATHGHSDLDLVQATLTLLQLVNISTSTRSPCPTTPLPTSLPVRRPSSVRCATATMIPLLIQLTSGDDADLFASGDVPSQPSGIDSFPDICELPRGCLLANLQLEPPTAPR